MREEIKTMINKIIAFDMDGTIADLYRVDYWLEKLRAEDASPYLEAAPMCDMAALRSICEALAAEGWEIRVITWLSRDSSEAYKDMVRAAKMRWLYEQGLMDVIQHFHGVQYGATKYDSIRKVHPDRAILVDDNAKVRAGWNGETINPTACDIIEALTALLENA